MIIKYKKIMLISGFIYLIFVLIYFLFFVTMNEKDKTVIFENVLKYNTEVSFFYTNALATLNGEQYISGTIISEAGNYTLIITDRNGNRKVATFEIDYKAPEVKGVLNNESYNTSVVPIFTEGEATLNGVAFTSGTIISVAGKYTLVVTDEAGNRTIKIFEIDFATPEVIVDRMISAFTDPLVGAAVEAARTAYNALTDIQKSLVTGLVDLEAAELLIIQND